MKFQLHSLFIMLALSAGVHVAAAQGTAFTYQGRLQFGGSPTNGIFDFIFKLYDTNSGGNLITYDSDSGFGVAVSNGLFTTTINFGTNYPGADRWLEIEVGPGGFAEFHTLSPRQKLTAVPYAITAANLTGTLPVSQLTGTLPNSFIGGTYTNAVTFNNAASSFSGNAATATSATTAGSAATANNFSGSLSGDVTGTQTATVVLTVGGVTSADVASGANAANAASSANIADTILKRDISGNVSAGSVTLDNNLYLPAPTAKVYSGAAILLHSDANGNFFAGPGAGNSTTSGQGNTANGYQAAQLNTSGSANTAVGLDALLNNTTGNYNIALGDHAGFSISLGSSNIDIGNMGAATDTNIIRIGNGQTQTFIAGVINGNGAGLTALNAAAVTGGTLADVQLSANVALRAGGNAFTGNQIVAGGNVGIGKTNPATALDVNGTVNATAFSGNGAALTSLNAANLSGTLPLAQLPGAVVTNNETSLNLSGAFSGNYSGSGAGLTGLNLNLNSGGAIQPYGAFLLSSSPGVGNSPQSVVAADVNGDGRVDLISANYSSSTLSVLTNNGSGGFVLASSPGVGSGPLSVVAADVNGDGRVDLISANYSTSTLSVLTNNGSGGFVLASSPGVGSGPGSVVAVDVNGDGKIDLISANLNANTLTVLTNNGSGGFVLASTLIVGSSPSSVLAADVNGDGRADLICANYGDNTLSVLTNNGGGGFVLAATLTVGATPVSVVAADVNGDGRLNLISANETANTLSVLINNGSGGFVLAATLTVGATPVSIVAADINGDGRVDLISANSGNNTLSVLTNNGSGGFALASSPAVGSFPLSVVAADVNGDGRLDLISANNGANTFSVLLSQARFDGMFNGGGAGLTALNASQLASGTVADVRLSTNVALLNANQTFTGLNTFNNAANSFTGNGGGLTSLNASQLTSGTVPLARLPSAVVTNNASGISLSGSLSGNGGGLTNLNAANIRSGTLADAQLSGNVAFLNSSPTFAGDITMSGGAAYHNLSLSGGNSLGFLYGSYLHFGDGIHLGYNYYADAAGNSHVIAADAGTSRISAGYGTISLATGGVNTAPTDALTVNKFGAVGIGTASPRSQLEVNGSVRVGGNLLIDNGSSAWSLIPNFGNLEFLCGNVFGYISSTDGSYHQGSDLRLKRDIKTIDGSLDRLLQLRPVSYHLSSKTNAPLSLGLIAQEVEPLFPEVVGTQTNGMKDIAYSELVPITIRAIQELHQSLETQLIQKDAEIERLKQSSDVLAKQLNELQIAVKALQEKK